MSKRAEKAALKAYPVNMQYSTVYDCVYDLAQIERKKFLKVYEQAEKDLALTWEDIKAIDELLTLVYEPDNEEGYYTRVLEEFNRKREEK